MPRSISTPRLVGALALLTTLALGASACSGSSGSDAKVVQKADMATSTAPGNDDQASSNAKTTSTTTDPSAAPAGAKATGAAVPSAGCGTSTIKAVDAEKRPLPGSDRWYLLTTPPEHEGTTPLPLVVDYHGLSEGAELHAMFSGFGAYAAEHGFVLVAPNGTGTPVGWRVSPDRKANPDLVFTDRMLDQLEKDLCVDTSRVYATGLSNGAFVSSTLACSSADRFAAVAPVAGLVDVDGCRPSRPVPILAFHGTADPLVLFNGGFGSRLGSVLSGQTGGADPASTGSTTTEAPLAAADLDGEGFPANAAAWAKRNGCTGEPSDTDLTPTVIERTWDCPADAPVIFDIVQGGGHSWPGSEFSQKAENIVGPTDMSIDATDLIWTFFERFQLPKVDQADQADQAEPAS